MFARIVNIWKGEKGHFDGRRWGGRAEIKNDWKNDDTCLASLRVERTPRKQYYTTVYVAFINTLFRSTAAWLFSDARVLRSKSAACSSWCPTENDNGYDRSYYGYHHRFTIPERFRGEERARKIKPWSRLRMRMFFFGLHLYPLFLSARLTGPRSTVRRQFASRRRRLEIDASITATGPDRIPEYPRECGDYVRV